MHYSIDNIINIIIYKNRLNKNYEKFNINYLKDFIKFKNHIYYGDWGLGIGDWAQSPIPTL